VWILIKKGKTVRQKSKGTTKIIVISKILDIEQGQSQMIAELCRFYECLMFC
jgi:hypothetical protein